MSGEVVRGEPEWALVTVMFVDIRGYTTFAHSATAREAVAYLDAFFEVTLPVVARHGGRVHQLLGDGFLALFGAPEPLADHADRAVAAARELLEVVPEQLDERYRIGVGVHSGLVLVGTMGGGGHAEFGVVGDPVNVASRVQDATKEAGEPCLITEATRVLLDRPDHGLEPRPPLALRGKPEPIAVFAPVTRAEVGS